MRLEKPHSLSYQATTRTKLPSITLVWSRATVADEESWLRSDDTSFSLVTVMMPLRRFDLDASISALLTSSALVLRLATNLKSISDTLGVGTRMEAPSSLPLSSGSTSPGALAAPVVVGMMFKAAARAR